MGSRARLYQLPLLCNGTHTGTTGSAVCLCSGWSGGSLVNPLLNSCSCDTGNKYFTLFFLLQVKLKRIFPEFLQIWQEGCGFCFYFSGTNTFYNEVSFRIDDFQSFVFRIPLALMYFLLCRGFSISYIQQNIPKSTQESNTLILHFRRFYKEP